MAVKLKKKKKATPMPPTPTLDKMREIKDRSQVIGGFLDWLFNEKNLHLYRDHEHTERCWDEDGDSCCGLSEGDYEPVRFGIEQILGDYFEIDLDAAEKEREALLDWVRKRQGG